MELRNTYNHLHTTSAIFVALIAWRIIYQALMVGFNSQSFIVENTDLWPVLYQDVISPGLAGYIAVKLVSTLFVKANISWVIFIYCLPIVGISIVYFIFTNAVEVEYSLGQQMLELNTIALGGQLMNWSISSATCIGSALAFGKCKGNCKLRN